MLLYAMDYMSELAYLIRVVIAQTEEGPMEATKERDTLRMGTGAMLDTLGNKKPNSTIPLFPAVSVDAPDLSAILQTVPEETHHQVLQDRADEHIRKIHV